MMIDSATHRPQQGWRTAVLMLRNYYFPQMLEVCARTKAHQKLSAALAKRCGALLPIQSLSAPASPQVEELFQNIIQFLQKFVPLRLQVQVLNQALWL
jgi:hypothetical protein